MRVWMIICGFSMFGMNIIAHAQDLGQLYISKWQVFYPGKALQQGIHQTVFYYEDFSMEKIEEWLEFNRKMLEKLSDHNHPYVILQPIDTRLLRVQIKREIFKWQEEKPHQTDADLYLDIIKEIAERTRKYDFLTPEDQRILKCTQIEAIGKLCHAAVQSLKEVKQQPSLSILYDLMEEFKSHCLTENEKGKCNNLVNYCDRVLEAISMLIDHLQKLDIDDVVVNADILGESEYARRLALYTDSDLKPEVLRDMAREEIELTRDEMTKVAHDYLQESYTDLELPTGQAAIINRALMDMEKEVVSNATEYLEFWRELTASAERFVQDHNIATLPKYPSLRIETAPESAGPAARIGWVDSAPPFAPNPVTTLYLPSIPDTVPDEEQREFWSSFNKPFNRMIAIHELIPGHYTQLKISRESAHPIRLLFPYGPYIEGWATFCEKILLDAGWDKERPLTYLAHLRKRLENANRAYTSVMVHCFGWSKDQVMTFSTETSLLAPQFAKSLWGRLLRSPMQITSYYYGGREFRELYARVGDRQGNAFDLRHFMDTIMKTGPIPIDAFDTIFQTTTE